MVCLLCCSIVCSMFHVPSKQALFFRQGVLYVDVGLSSFATLKIRSKWVGLGVETLTCLRVCDGNIIKDRRQIRCIHSIQYGS